LAAGDGAVEVRVPEEARALASPQKACGLGEFAPISRVLALGVELFVAEVAVAAGDVEGDHDPVAVAYVRNVPSDLLDDAYRFVADDVALPHDGVELAIEM